MMKKFKFLSVVLIVFTLIVNMFPMSAFANPCCELEIESVFQSDDGIITVSYKAYNPLPEREVCVTVYKTSDKGRVEFYKNSFYITSSTFRDEYTFDGSFLLEGEEYVISINYTNYCDNYYCGSGGDDETITIIKGVPVIDYEDITDGMLQLIGINKAAVKFSSTVRGMYDLYIYNDDGVDVRSFPHNEYVSMGIVLFEENEERIYVVSNPYGDDLSCEVYFEKVPEYTITPEIINPSNNDICFRMSDVNGLMRIDIAKSGVYQFEISDNGRFDHYELIDANANFVSNCDDDSKIKEYLGKGTYFVDTINLYDGYNMTVKYIEAEELTFGKVYTPEFGIAYVEKYHYRMTLAKPAVITVDNIYDAIILVNKDATKYNFHGEGHMVLGAGEYYVTIFNQQTEDSEITFEKNDFESIPLDTYVLSQNLENVYYYHFAFCAPEDGVYEFDFTKYRGYYWFDGEWGAEQNGSMTDYYSKEMSRGEWLLISMHEEAEVMVTKRGDLVAVPLTYDEPAYFDFVSGRSNLYSFTPDEDGLYRLFTENICSSYIKVWTDEEVLYETDDNRYYSIDKKFDLKKNEPVYVEFGGDGDSYGAQSMVIFTSPYIKISDGVTVTLDDEEDVLACYVAEESGYYNFNFSRGYGSYDDAFVEIDGGKYAIYNGYSRNVVVYIEKDEKIDLTFKKFTDSQVPDVYVGVSLLDVTEMDLDTSYTPSMDKYYSFVPDEDGVYKITFPYDYNLQISGGGNEYIGLQSGCEQYFTAKKDDVCLIYVTESYFQYGEDQGYTDMRITGTQGKAVNIYEDVVSAKNMELYELIIPEDGVYRITNEICNASLAFYNDEFGEWRCIIGDYASLYKLKKGVYYLMSVYETQSAANPDGDLSGIDDPYVKFKVIEAEDKNNIGVSIVDAYASPMDISASIIFCLTSPCETHDYEYGIEYQDDNGDTVTRYLGYETMYATDMRYAEGNIYSEWSTGDTVTVKPFVCVDGDMNNIIYGEEKTITFKLRDDITELKQQTNKVSVTASGKYTYYSSDNWYSFVQPETSEPATYIDASGVFGFISLYDEDYEYVSQMQDANGRTYYELEPGKKYYIFTFSSYTDSDAEICISSLSDSSSDDNTEILSNVDVNGNTVSFTVSTDKVCSAYVASYTEGGALLELKIMKNAKGSYNIPFTKTGVHHYKVMIMDSNMTPLCSAVEK